MIKKTLEAVRDRLHLVVPTAKIVDETLATSYDGSRARLTLSWNEQAIEKLGVNISSFVKATVGQIVPSTIEVQHQSSPGHLTLTLDSLVRTADNLIKPLTVPIFVEYGDTTYGIESPDSGTTFNVTRNGEAVEEDCPSVAAALGKLQKHLLVDLSYTEELEDPTEDVQNQIDTDFMVSIAEWMMNSPAVPEEAKKNLILFVEFLTNRDFESEEPEELG